MDILTSLFTSMESESGDIENADFNQFAYVSLSCIQWKKYLFGNFQAFFIVFDHVNTCASMRLLVEIHNTPSIWIAANLLELLFRSEIHQCYMSFRWHLCKSTQLKALTFSEMNHNDSHLQHFKREAMVRWGLAQVLKWEYSEDPKSRLVRISSE